MIPNLKLVVSSQSLPQSALSAASQDAKKAVRNPVVRNLVPMRHQHAAQTDKQNDSSLMFFIVIVAHIAGLAWLTSNKTSQPVIKEPLTPITVNLVNHSTPEPEIVPLLPTPQVVIKKTKPIVKQILATTEPAAEQPLVTPSAIELEAPPSPVAPVAIAKTPEVNEAPQQKVEHEPIVEPPRFGAAYLHNPAPDYPPLARRLGEQGRVLLRVLVSTNGEADNVQVETSSGSSRLDQAAVQAVKKWSFIPAKRNKQPIGAYVLVPVQFSLES